MAGPTFDQWASIFTAMGFSSVVTWWLQRRSQKVDEARREPADMTHAAAELQEALSAGSQELLGAFRKEFKFLRGRVADLQTAADTAHDAAIIAKRLAEEAVSRDANCQRELQLLRDQFEAMAASQAPPPYTMIHRMPPRGPK